MSVVGYDESRNVGTIDTSPLPENSSEEEWTRGSIEQPEYISARLFPHQLKSVGDMERFECREEINVPRDVVIRVPRYFPHFRIPQSKTFTDWNGYSNRKFRRFFGIQADMVGYGKTLSMVSLLSRDRMEWDMSTPFIVNSNFQTDMFTLSYKNIVKKVNVSLVLASLSCIRQWEEDFEKASNIKLLVVKTSKIVKDHCRNIVNKTDFPYNVILITPTMFKKFIAENRSVIWKRFIFDEPAQLRIPAMPDLMAAFCWFVTATPAYVVGTQGTANWVGKIFSWNYGNYSRIFTVKNPTHFVQKSFKMPKTHFRDYICWQPIAARLNGIVSNRVNQMIQAGDVQGAISAIGGTNCSKGNLIEIIRERKKRDLDYVEFHLGRSIARTASQSVIKDWSDRKDHILKQLEKLDETAKELMESQCPICLENLSEPMIMEPNCQKVFCAECFLTWHMTNSTCPMCRATVNAAQLIYVNDNSPTREETKSNTSHEKPLTKLQRIKCILQERNIQDEKSSFIIATQFGSTIWYNKIQKILDDMNIKWCKISGHMTTRNKNVKAFQNGITRVIFISNLDSTAGVNLQTATDVIIFNEMSESQREQVIGRANRIGRKQPLIVHTLYADNGMGERFRAT
jgi:SNF2 family DNA or RNA helicase